jgi:hypothetical protein
MSIEDIFSKLSLKEFRLHLSNYVNLYYRPLKVWRTIIGFRTTSYDLLTLHIIYYFVFALVAMDRPLKFTVFYIIAEVAVTTIPFLISLLPFLLLKSIIGFRIRPDRLFRLLLILKLQFIPVLFLAIFLAKKLRIDFVYGLIDNLIWLCLIAMMVVFPLLVRTSVWKKLLWITLNYFCFILIMTLVIISVSSVKIPANVIARQAFRTPSSEYASFWVNYKFSESDIDNNHLLLVGTLNNREEYLKNIRLQFVTYDLASMFRKTRYNQWRMASNRFDSLYPSSTQLSLYKLDSAKKSFQGVFYSDLEAIKRFKDSCTFESNRKYFEAFNNYLYVYERPFVNSKVFSKACSYKKNDLIIIEDSIVVILYTVDSSYYYPSKQQYDRMALEIEGRETYARFIVNIMLYPIVTFLEIFDLPETK